MATMERREVTRKRTSQPGDDAVSLPIADSNLIADSVTIHPVATTIHPVATLGFWQPTFGVPIMREGFITETGLLPTSNEPINLK
jgi:hypothetical protein